jgi:hypothetical protein
LSPTEILRNLRGNTRGCAGSSSGRDPETVLTDIQKRRSEKDKPKKSAVMTYQRIYELRSSEGITQAEHAQLADLHPTTSTRLETREPDT